MCRETDRRMLRKRGLKLIGQVFLQNSTALGRLASKDKLKHPTGMAEHEKYTCTADQTGERCVRKDWWISSKYSCRILPSLLAKPPKDILKHLSPDYVK